MRAKRLLRIVAFASSLALAAGCHPGRMTSESDVASLDQLASRGAAGFACDRQATPALEGLMEGRLKFAASVGAPQKNELKAAALASLAAAPIEDLRLFVALGGDLRITPKAATICKAQFAAQGGRATSSPAACWLARSAKGKQRSLAVVLDSSVDVVSHNVVRMLGYVIAQYVPKFDFTDGKATRRANTRDAFPSAAVMALTPAFLSDLEERGVMLSETIEAVRLAEDDAAVRKRFASFVLAEAYDSSHCSDLSRAAMARDFPKTREAYETVAAELAARVKSAGVKTAKKAAKPRAALTGFALDDGAAADFDFGTGGETMPPETTPTETPAETTGDNGATADPAADAKANDVGATNTDTVTVNVNPDGTVNVDKPDNITVVVNTPQNAADTGGVSTVGDPVLTSFDDTAGGTVPATPDPTPTLTPAATPDPTPTPTPDPTPTPSATSSTTATQGTQPPSEPGWNGDGYDPALSGWSGYDTFNGGWPGGFDGIDGCR